MASTSETGHNKNVANFSTAFQILQEMGTTYNPSNTNLLLTNLAPIKASLAATIQTFNTKKPIYTNAVASRELAIAPLPKLTTRTLNYAKSINISATDKENLTSQVKKIRGDVQPKKINPDTSETTSISTAQLSYDSRIANLAAYTDQLASHPQYAPNETELKVASLQSLHQNLVTLSSAVNTAGNALITARNDRNNILYRSQTNVIQLMKEIKAYLKSLGQLGEPYYKAIVKLQFKDLPK